MNALLIALVVAALVLLSLASTWSVRRRIGALAALLADTKIRTYWFSSLCSVEGRLGDRRVAISMSSIFSSGLTVSLETGGPVLVFEVLPRGRTAKALQAAVAGSDQARQVGDLLIGPLGEPEAISRWLSSDGNLRFVETLVEAGKVRRLQSSGAWLIASTKGLPRESLQERVSSLLENLRSLADSLGSGI